MELYEIEYFDLPDYRITKCGRVWSCISNRFLSQQKNPDNHYKFIFIRRKKYYIHRLVGYTFIDNPYDKNTIDHIDRNRHNNHSYNLRFATRKEQSANRSCNETVIWYNDKKRCWCWEKTYMGIQYKKYSVKKQKILDYKEEIMNIINKLEEEREPAVHKEVIVDKTI